MTKSTKSHLRVFSSLLKIFFRVHELVARSSAWRVCAIKGRVKVGSFAILHDFNHTTRADIAHEKAEQIRELFTRRRFSVERCFFFNKTGNFSHVEKRGKIINSLWKRLLIILIYNGFRVLLFQDGKKAVFRYSHKNHRKIKRFSLFPIKWENLHYRKNMEIYKKVFQRVFLFHRPIFNKRDRDGIFSFFSTFCRKVFHRRKSVSEKKKCPSQLAFRFFHILHRDYFLLLLPILFYFIFFYAKRERILKKRTHGVWKRREKNSVKKAKPFITVKFIQRRKNK